MSARIIAIRVQAPPKPAWAAPCNGCGICCLAEPCPLGMLVSRRRSGACAAVVFDDGAGCYRCGLLTDPQLHLPRLPRVAVGLVRRLAARWIAAGRGCDSSAEAHVV